MPTEFKVHASWDPEASVWVAESDDVPGLVTEAESLEQLLGKLKIMIPELLEANGALPPDDDEPLPFSLIAKEYARRRAA